MNFATGFDLTYSAGFVHTVAVCGDWHGNTHWATKTIRHADRLRCDALVQVGDFGFGWDDGKFVNAVSEAAVAANVPVLFVDGNHENFDELLAIPVREDGLRQIAPGVFHIPRGTRWEWQGHTWMGVGGGYSVDKPFRQEGISWWPQETVTSDEIAIAVQGGRVDVLITHDAGDRWEIPGTHRTRDYFPEDQIALSEQHRQCIQQIINETEPVLMFHGHYHTGYVETVEDLALRVQGMDKDEARFFGDHMVVVDCAGLEVRGV